MAIEDQNGATRRSVLAAAGGAALALVAQAIGRPVAVRAANGDPVLAGQNTTATSRTSVSATGVDAFAGLSDTGTAINGTSTSGIGVYAESAGTALHAGSYLGIAVVADTGATDQPASRARALGHSTGVYGYSGYLDQEPPAPPRVGVYGHSVVYSNSIGVLGRGGGATGVRGDALTGRAMHATATSGTALLAESQTGYGSYASSGAPDRAAAVGTSTTMTGLQGYSGTGPLPGVPPKTGVYGHAEQDVNATGVAGRTTAGRGVLGVATSGRAVYGAAANGTGGYFSATTGTALRAEGPVRFKTSGLATIAIGTRSTTVTPGMDVTTSSKILVTLQGDAGGSTVIQRVAINATANTFTIYLTANSVRDVKVSWFVIS
jgi:hypothetical protein